MKRIISSLLSAAMLVSAFAAYAAAPQTPSDGSFDIAYIGSASSKAWQEALTSKLDESMDTVTGTYITAATMQEAQLNIPQIKAAKPDMVVIDASIANSTENQYFESVLLSLLDLDEQPYVAYVTDAGFTATDTIRRIKGNFGGEWLSLADAENASSAEDYAVYLASGLEYKKLTVPSPAAKLSSYSSDMSPVSRFSGTLTDESKVINTYGNYVIVKTSASSGTYTVTVDGRPSTVISAKDGISYSKYDWGDRKHEVVIAAAGEVNIEGIYSEPDGVKNNIRLGFEDNDLTAVSHNGTADANNATIEWVNAGANGSTGAVHLTKKTVNGEVAVPVMLKYNTKYRVSAKVNVITEGVTTMNIFAYQERFKDDNPSKTLASGKTWIQKTVSNLPANEWYDISVEFDIKDTAYAGSSSPNTTTSEYGEIAFRLGGDPSSEVYIDDIVIEPVISNDNIYSLDMDFEDESVSPGAPQPNSKLSFVKGAGEDGGTVLEAVAYSNEIISVSNMYIVPNRHYTISYKIRGISDNSVGKTSKLIIDRYGKHKNSKGETAKAALSNYEYVCPATITKEWQTVTIDHISGDKVTDDMGLCKLYFKLFNTANNNGDAVDAANKITIQIDDFKITPNELIYNGNFESGYKPTLRNSKTTTISIVSDNSINGESNKVLKATYTSADYDGDILYNTAIESFKPYKLTFKVKSEDETGNELLPIFSGGSGKVIDENNDYKYLSKFKFSNEWTEYSAEFTYSTASGINKFPQLIIRPTNAGTIYIDDIKLERVYTEGLYNIQLTGDMMSKERSEITFSDYSASSKGYVYTIYSLDSSKNKTIYAFGETTGRAIKFINYANPGTHLYADIVYVNEAGAYSTGYTADLGIAGGNTGECVITAAFSDDSDMMSSITGQVAVSNNGQTRKVIIGVATYGENMNLLSFDSDEYEITPYVNRTFELSVYPDADLAYYAKVFAWDSLTGMTPYCTSDMIEY